MIDRASVADWLNNYVQAWKTYDPQAIAALFAENARYSFHPFDSGDAIVVGRDAIVANWLDNQDKPGTYDAHYEPVAVDGDTAVANGRSSYFEDDGKTLKRIFDNVFILRFDADGRCTEFREWYMQPRNP